MTHETLIGPDIDLSQNFPGPIEVMPEALVEAKPRLLDQEISRRDFLRVYGKAAGVTAVLAYGGLTASVVRDGLEHIEKVEKKIWPENKPTLNFLNDAVYAGQKEVALYFPGYGDMHSEIEARQWKRSGNLPKDMLTGYVDYSNEGAGVDDVVKLIHEQIDVSQLESLTLFGNSMGGLYAIEAATRLGIPVKSLEMCSTPSSFKDAVYLSGGAKVGSMLPTNRTLATIGKFVANYYHYHHFNGYTAGESLTEGMDQTLTGASPVALQQELKTAMGIDILGDEMRKPLQRVFIPGFSHVAYAGTLWPSTDDTVKIIKSGQDYKKLFNDELGVNFKLFGIKYRGHANVQATVEATRSWTESVSSLSQRG